MPNTYDNRHRTKEIYRTHAMTCIEEKESIYIKKNVCLFVRYAFSPCNSYRHQTFHDTSLGPEEGRHGVGITKKGQEGGYLGEIPPR
jgi:hypothetical protein